MPNRIVLAVLTIALCATVVLGTPSLMIGRPRAGLPSMLDIATEIVRPDTYEAPGLIPVQVRLTNMGDTSARVPHIIVKIVPSGYRDSLGYVTVGVGENKVVTLNPWVSPAGSHETCTAWITYPADSNHSNDTDVVFVRTASGLDVATEIVSPADSEEPGLVPVQIRLTNMGIVPALVPRLDVIILPSGYADYVPNISVGVGGDTLVTISPWVCPAYSEETCTAWITYPSDTNHANDTDVVIVRTGPFPGVSGGVATDLILSPGLLTGSIARAECRVSHAGPASVTLFDINGQAVLKRSLGAADVDEVSLDLRNLSAGVYLVRVDDGRQSVVQKLVVQR